MEPFDEEDEEHILRQERGRQPRQCPRGHGLLRLKTSAEPAVEGIHMDWVCDRCRKFRRVFVPSGSESALLDAHQ